MNIKWLLCLDIASRDATTEIGVNLINKLLFILLIGFLSACSSGSSSGPEAVINPVATSLEDNTNGTCTKLNPPLFKSQQGEATFYEIGELGNCSLPVPEDLMIAAINNTQYAGSIACGTCLAVSGPSGEVVVKVVDRCPECLPGDLDLSEAAFAKIANPAQGRVDITWNEIPCDALAPVQYQLKAGSNQWWVAIQIRNHRHRIDTLEALTPNNQYQLIPRKNYNYFVAEKGLGSGPITLRITDIYGNIIEDSSIPVQENTLINSHTQFPVCDS